MILRNQKRPYPFSTKFNREAEKSSDFVNYHTSDDETMPYWISYYRPSLDGEKLQKYLMPTLLERPNASLEELKEHIPMSGITITNDLQKLRTWF